MDEVCWVRACEWFACGLGLSSACLPPVFGGTSRVAPYTSNNGRAYADR